MMLRINSVRWIVATLVFVIGAMGRNSAGQVQPPPSAAEAFATFSQIETWLNAWRVPSEFDDGVPVPMAPLDSAMAASVELRLDGRIIGRGASATSPTWLNATRMAMEEARTRLPVRNDALLQENLREHARRATVSVELAGDFIPVRGSSTAEIDREAQMGVQGIAVRAGERVETMFPGSMLSTGTSPGTAASILIRRLRPDVLPFAAKPAEGLTPDDLIRDGSVIVYTFRTIHVAQPSPGRPAAVLQRGGRVVEVSQITTESLIEMAEQMAHHLIARRWPLNEALGMVGTVHPVTGRSEPMVATAYEQAMSAMALRRFARTAGVAQTSALEAEAVAVVILTELASVEVTEIAPWNDAASSAMCVIAATQGGRTRDIGFEVADMLDKCAESVRAAFDTEAGFSATLPEAARGDVSLALVRLAFESGEPDEMNKAEQAIRRSLIDAGPGGLPMLLPWIGFAEVELAGTAAIPSAVALRDARDLVWEHQMTRADVDADTRDFIGGIVFTRTGNMVPSWQSAKPIAFIAKMLGDERLTETDEQGAEIIRMVQAMRFLRQLMADKYVGYRYANPAKAIGGVRTTLWDDRMPAPATALSLLAACEMVDSLEKMKHGGR